MSQQLGMDPISYVPRPTYEAKQNNRMVLGFAIALIMSGSLVIYLNRLYPLTFSATFVGKPFLSLGFVLFASGLVFFLKKRGHFSNSQAQDTLILPTKKNFCLAWNRFAHGQNDHRNPLWDTWQNIVLMPLGGFRKYPPSPEEMKELYGPSPVTPMQDQLRIRWMGHNSFLIETEKTTLLTDPNWSNTIPFLETCFGEIPLYYRSVPPGLPFESVPKISNVLLSHTHRDHCDLPTLNNFNIRDEPIIFCPANAASLLTNCTHVHEMTWWQKVELSGGITITYVPANHASQTNATDCNKYLFGGYMISVPIHEGKDVYTIYSMGDTACNINPAISGFQPELASFDQQIFENIASQFPSIDLILLQTDPVSGQEDKHFNVLQGIDLMERILKPKKIIPTHWGTWPFNQWGCDLLAPVRILRETLKEQNEDLYNKFHQLKVGECVTLVPKS